MRLNAPSAPAVPLVSRATPAPVSMSTASTSTFAFGAVVPETVIVAPTAAFCAGAVRVTVVPGRSSWCTG